MFTIKFFTYTRMHANTHNRHKLHNGVKILTCTVYDYIIKCLIIVVFCLCLMFKQNDYTHKDSSFFPLLHCFHSFMKLKMYLFYFILNEFNILLIRLTFKNCKLFKQFQLIVCIIVYVHILATFNC